MAEGAKKLEEPIVVNGDIVEYGAESQEVSATGNVEVIYKGSKLTCDKLVVNTQTKEGRAEGNARLDDENGVIVGDKILYNFQTKSGTIIDAGFRANPYFGKAQEVNKVSENEFVARSGFASTCSYDNPHYRIQSREIRVFPGDKIQTRHNVFKIGGVPIFYLPWYNHSLKDPLMHVQVMPGKRKEWGGYVLTAWRYNLTDYMDGRIYLDYRQKLGFAEGFGMNYNTRVAGKGDLKFYYTEEHPDDLPASMPQDYERYLVRLRHKWEIDPRTLLTAELYKVGDDRRKYDSLANFLKTYFYREFEKDSQPQSYVLLNHRFSYSSLDVLFLKRVNHWFDYVEKAPEIKYTMPNIRMGPTPFYFESQTMAASYNRKGTQVEPSTDEIDVSRFDTYNKISLPFKLAFLTVTPYVADRFTLYDKEVEGNSLPDRTVFYSGASINTKFYRIYNASSNFLGMDINGLRHIITPAVNYSYTHEPTVFWEKLKQIDSIDAITRGNVINLELANKLQTKRGNNSVDLLNCIFKTSYANQPKYGEKRGSSFSDFLVDLELMPYSWLRIDADATFKHSGSRADAGYNRFANVNYDVNFMFGKERSLGVGQRYERSGSNEITGSLLWRLNPKWKVKIYERYNLRPTSELSGGLREQEYTISRDLHCWEMDVTYNIRKEEGHTLWCIFRLKAFPELEFGFDQSYNKPTSGAQ